MAWDLLAAHLLACTEGFTRFATARRLACQAGVAPYEHSSGSSIHGRTRVSPQADRVLKTLLHMAALGVIARAGELQDYYKRKRAEGKAPMLVINAVRCKEAISNSCVAFERGTMILWKSGDFPSSSGTSAIGRVRFQRSTTNLTGRCSLPIKRSKYVPVPSAETSTEALVLCPSSGSTSTVRPCRSITSVRLVLPGMPRTKS
ncbi:MAG: IS110 family transposase [Flavobacteriales bacterium]|nr:IS110 family transposase [Flavobacteriales bacterium]